MMNDSFKVRIAGKWQSKALNEASVAAFTTEVR